MLLLVLTVNGGGVLEYDGKQFLLEKGSVFLINCDKPQKYYTLKSEEHWEIKWIRFTGIACEGFYNLLYKDKQFFVMHAYGKTLDTLLEYIYEQLEIENGDCDFLFSNAISQILTELAVSARNSHPDDSSINIVDAARNYLDHNYHKQILISDLANAFFISKYALIRMFKKKIGVTPYAYLSRTRINISKQLLEGTSLSIGEISEKVGFDNVNNFIRNFKRYVDTTPMKYKKSI